jgi:hypothetical protein
MRIGNIDHMDTIADAGPVRRHARPQARGGSNQMRLRIVRLPDVAVGIGPGGVQPADSLVMPATKNLHNITPLPLLVQNVIASSKCLKH